MSYELQEPLIKHILYKLGILSENQKKSFNSLLAPYYELKEKIKFSSSDNEIITNKIYGCQISTGSQEIKMILGNLLINNENVKQNDYYLIIHLKDAPYYAINYSTEFNNEICYSLDGKEWANCSMYLQACLLAGMEQISDSGLSWVDCVNYKDEYNSLLSFIDHLEAVEESDEG